VGFETPEEAIGQDISRFIIVGVVKDFHFRSAHQEIESLVLSQNRLDQFYTLVVRTTGVTASAALAGLEEAWKEATGGEPFEYSFLTDEINDTYAAEQRLARVFSIFAGLAIGIACLGLFALAAYSAANRTREIGIRKVLGASEFGIVSLLSREFALLLFVSMLLSSPVIAIAGNRWLDNFAYRTDVGVVLFVWAGGVALIGAAAATLFQSLRAALANPVDSLRHE
jgi:putative ABC transport system permease protein